MKTTTGLMLSAAAVTALLSSACSKDKGPSCGQVAAHFMSRLDAELARDGDPDRLNTARANRPALQDRLLKACEEQKWSLTTKQCILDAGTAAETKSCVPAAATEPVAEPPATAPGAK